MKVRKGDKVLITAGKSSGKSGNVTRVLPKAGKVVVEGLNIVKKAVKPSPKNPAGGIVEVTNPIDVSNVAVVCPRCSKPTRLGWEVSEKDKSRICKKCKEKI
jgi:large subunit ribosomal protein L24